MNLLDVLDLCGRSDMGHMLFRPASWQGSGAAYKLSEDGVCCQIGPGPLTGKYHASMTFLVAELTGAWEFIHIDQVRREQTKTESNASS